MARADRARLDAADLRILRFLAEHRAATAAHVETLLGVSSAAVAPRLRALAGHGYVGRERIFTGQPAALWITRVGLGVIERRLPAPRLDLKGYRHDVGVAWLWLAAEDGAFGPAAALRSEREMRSHDARAQREGPPFGVGLGTPGPRGGEALHYPDLLLETPAGRRVAFELELTAKSARRLDQIMLGYACDPRLDAVIYLCPPGHVARRVQDAARRAGISGQVRVQHLAEGSPRGAPDAGRVRTGGRAPARGAER